MDCIVYLRKLLENKKRKRKLTFKKAYLAIWGEDEVEFDDEEEKDEKAHHCLMAFDDEANEVFDSNLSYSSDDNDDDDDDMDDHP